MQVTDHIDDSFVNNSPELAAELAILQQRQASDPTHSVYLSASAGTGKTKVLVDRVLRLLLDGAPPSNILCITYTNAAADEMYNRIYDALYKWSITDAPILQDYLYQLTGQPASSALVDRAKSLYSLITEDLIDIRIQTIHAMCAQILTSTHSATASGPQAQIISNTQRNEIRARAMEELLVGASNNGLTSDIENLLELTDWDVISMWLWKLLEQKAAFKSWVKQYESREALAKHIYHRHGAKLGISSKHMILEWLLDLHVDIAKLEHLQILLRQDDHNYAKKIEQWVQLYNSRLQETTSKHANGNLSSYDMDEIQEIWQRFQLIWLTAEGEPRKKIYPNSFAQRYPEDAAYMLAMQERVWKHSQDLRTQRAATHNAAFCSLAKDLLDIYEKIRNKAQLMEYEDLLCATIDLLSTDNANNILYQLDMRLDHVLVDEAQDLSALQWQLVKIITDEFFVGIGARDELLRTIFIVGDFKQSIYGFQGASPQEFLNVKQYFRNKVISANLSWCEVQLEVSFRTTAAVLEAVDKLFANLENMGAIGVSQELRHIPYRSGGGIIQSIDLISNNNAMQHDDERKHRWSLPWERIHSPDAPQQLADSIADMIFGWLQEQRKLMGHNRTIVPSDIMILLKRRGGLANRLLHAFRNRGIAVSNPDRLNISEHLITMDLLSFAHFYLYPNDDLNLAGLLKSPLIGMNEGELYNIASSRGQKSLWQFIREKYEYIHGKLGKLRIMARNYDITTFYHMLIKQEHLQQKWESVFGKEAIDVYYNFIELLAEWEEPQLKGQWYEFITWARNGGLKETRSASRHNSVSSTGVRIMTVHSAKGLQAPIVFLADAASSAHQVFERIIFADDGEPYLNMASGEADQRTMAVRHYQKLKNDQENNRLLYVAMTRAEDELYLCGWENNRIAKSWHNRANNY